MIHWKNHKNSFYTTFSIKWMQFILFYLHWNSLSDTQTHLHKRKYNIQYTRGTENISSSIWRDEMMQSISHCASNAKRLSTKTYRENPKIWFHRPNERARSRTRKRKETYKELKIVPSKVKSNACTPLFTCDCHLRLFDSINSKQIVCDFRKYVLETECGHFLFGSLVPAHLRFCFCLSLDFTAHWEKRSWKRKKM